MRVEIRGVVEYEEGELGQKRGRGDEKGRVGKPSMSNKIYAYRP